MRVKIKSVIMTMLATTSLIASDRSSIKPNGCKGPILCPTQPIVNGCEDCRCSWQVDIGVLYQQLGFAYTNSGIGYQPVFQDPTLPNALAFENQVVSVLREKYNYSAGLTVGLGRVLNHDDWCFQVNFNWLSASINAAHNSEGVQYRPSSDFPVYLFNHSDFPLESGYFQKIAYISNANIYDLNIQLSRGSYQSDSYSLEPFTGVKALWFDNKQNKKYQEPSTTTTSRVSFDSKQNNWGVGPVFGGKGEYNIAEGFCIFSDNSIGILYGEGSYKATSTLTSNSSGNSDFPKDRVVTNPEYMDGVIYVPLRTILGLKFSRYYMNKSHYLAVKIGYDLRAVLSPSKEAIVSQIIAPNNDSVTNIQVINIENGFYASGLFFSLTWNH